MTGSTQRRSLRRLPIAVLVLLALAVLVPAAGASGFGGLDRDFGTNGVVDLSYEPSPGVFSVANAVATAPDGRIYVLGASIPCAGCGWVEHLTRYRPNGARDLSYAGDGTAELPTVPYSSYHLLVDGRGRQVVAYVNESELVVMRLLPGGGFDAGFGSGGFVRFECDCGGAGAELRVNPPGRLQVAVSRLQRSGPEPESLVYRSVVETRSLLEDGQLDAGFGAGGVSVYRVENAFSPSAAIRLHGGGLAIAGGNWSGPAQLYAGRLDRQGRLDEGFMNKARRALSARLRRQDTELLRAGGLMPRGGGKLDVFGHVGFDGFVARLDRSGALDRSFGTAGVRPLPWPVRETLAGPGGRVFALGERDSSLTVGWLGRGGRPLRSFAGGRGVDVPGGFADEAVAAMQRGSRPLVLMPGFEFCRGYCPPHPQLYRFTRWAR